MDSPTEAPRPVEQLSPRELADSWLSIRKTELEREYTRTQEGLKYSRSYKPTPIGPRPSWLEPGGMDESIWKAEVGGDAQWEESEERIYDLEDKLYRLEDDLGQLSDDRSQVEDGDEERIQEFASLERQRRAELEESESIKREKSEGISIEGGEQVVATITEILDLVDQKKIPASQEGSNGWSFDGERAGFAGEDSHKYDFVYRYGEGAFNDGASKLSITREKGGEYYIHFVDTKENPIERTRDRRGKDAPIFDATAYHFRLAPDGSKVTNQSVSHGRPHQDSFGHITYTGYYEINNERFTQTHFDEFRGRLSIASQDMKQVANP